MVNYTLISSFLKITNFTRREFANIHVEAVGWKVSCRLREADCCGSYTLYLKKGIQARYVKVAGLKTILNAVLTACY
jgi:hypothetical protein